MACILSLSHVLRPTITSLIPIASLALHFDSNTNPEVSDNLCAKVFGASVKALAQDSQSLNGVDTSLWIITAVKKWPQSQIVLEGLVALAKWFANLDAYCTLTDRITVANLRLKFPLLSFTNTSKNQF